MKKEEKFLIYGSVLNNEGLAVRDASVIAWWQRIREPLPVGSAKTNEEGKYRMEIALPEDIPGKRFIVVEARSEFFNLPIRSNPTEAKPELEIDLTAQPVDSSVFTTLIGRIKPLIDRLNLTEVVESAEHQDISFLAMELNISPEKIMQVVVAERMGETFKVTPAGFFSFLNQLIPSGLPKPLLDASQQFTLIIPLVHSIGSMIFGLTPDMQRNTLINAIALNIIGSQYTDKVSEIVAQLQANRSFDLLNQPYLVGSSTLSQLLAAAALPASRQQAFSQALSENTQSMRNFWRSLGQGQSGFSQAEASTIERTISIGSFVKNYVPLVTVLMKEFSAGTYKTLADLAKLNVNDWVRLLNQTGTPPGIDAAGNMSPAEVFARVIYTRVARAYPTAALSQRIISSTSISPKLIKPITQFFGNNAELELIKENIPVYLKTKGATAFNGIELNLQQAVIKHVRIFQRLLRTAPDPDISVTLFTMGIGSASEIARMGQQQFFLKATAVGITKPEAEKTFKVAVNRNANLVSLYMKLNIDALGLLPQFMGSSTELGQITQQAIQKDQSLATLFGSQDYCETDDCTSILSPAAYLCDLLLWLFHQTQGSGTALDVLDSRRPDIRHLLLNCPNSETEMPFIDLIIELLSDAISAPVDLLDTSYTQKGLTNGTTYYFIITALNVAGESIASVQLTATPVAPIAVPAAPAGFAVTPGEGSVVINWNESPGADNYNIYWSLVTGVTPLNGNKIPGASTPFEIDGLSNGATYYYIVTGENIIGEGPASAEASVTPAAAATLPPTPAGVTVNPGNGSVIISWTAVPATSSYNVYYSTTNGFAIANGVKTVVSTSSFMLEQLVNGTTYYFLVTAVNSVGESLPSVQTTTVPVIPAAPPATPVGGTVQVGNGELILNWNSVTGADSYNIYWSTTTGVTVKNGNQIVGSLNPKWKQTSDNLSAAQLSASPEYFNYGAFSTLFNANYPQNLPYSAGLDSLRTYVQQLGLPLWQIKSALLPLSGATLAQNAAVAAERFGNSPHYSDLMTNINFVPRNIAWNTGTQDPVNALVPLTAPAANPSQPAFLSAASITYEQLLELLEVNWVQGVLNVSIAGIDDLCMTSQQSLSPAPLDPGFLDRSHRFLRLWLSTGYEMWELDLLLINNLIGNNLLDASALTNIFNFRRLQDQTKLSVNQLLVFFQQIDIKKHRDHNGNTVESLFSQVFLSPSVVSIAPDNDVAVLPYGGAVSDPVLANHLPAIQAALSVSASDAAVLITLTDNQLSLDNLSLMYRIVMLANASKLSISSVLSLSLLLNPASAGFTVAVKALFSSLTATSSFLTQVIQIKQSSMTTDVLIYLLTPPANTVLSNAILAADTALTVAADLWFPSSNFKIQIGAEIMLVTSVGGPQNTSWTVSRGQMGTVAAPAAAGTSLYSSVYWSTSAQMTLDDISTTLTAIQQSAFALLSTNAILVSDITALQTSLVVNNYLGYPAPPFSVTIGSETLLVTAVSGNGNTTWTVTRAQAGTAAAAAAAGTALIPTGDDIDGIIISVVAANAHNISSSGISNDVTALILNNLQVPGTAFTLLSVLSDTSFLTSAATIDNTNFPNQFLAIQLFDKVAVLVRSLKLVTDDLNWLLLNAGVYQGLNFLQLPVTVAQPALALTSLLNTLLVIKLARLWTIILPPSSVQTLYDIISGVNTGTLANETQTQAALATLTGWIQTDIQNFATALGIVFPASYLLPATYDALRTLEAMISKTGTNASQLIFWSTIPPDEQTASGMASVALGVLKASQPNNDSWLSFAPKFMNPIRDRRSAALQSYLIGLRDFSGNLIYGDTNGLFDYFLIDTQMSSCQVTSRIVQAYIAVQIFVERCNMNLEAPEVVVDLNSNDTWAQWEWMKRYRIWEANREVFLYPENWLIESQRPNRTEIYQKFEEEVRQGTSTTDYLETVVLNYIDRLDGISHLQVTGTCEDPLTSNIYVVARSLSDPPTYYIRSYITGAWSGWSQIKLDIRAHQVVPTIYRGRICIFWIDVKSSNEPKQDVPPPQTSSTPGKQTIDRYVSIAVNFSVFRNGNWTPSQSAKGKLFDKPIFDSSAQAVDSQSVESLYTVKIQNAPTASGYGTAIYVDVFRLGSYDVQNMYNEPNDPMNYQISGIDLSTAVHLGRAVFDGRFSDLELNNFEVPGIYPDNTDYAFGVPLLVHAKTTYGPDALPLIPLTVLDPPIVGDSNLAPIAGVLAGFPKATASTSQTVQLNFTSASSLEQNAGPLITAQLPVRVAGPSTNINFDPASYFFFQDTRRSYYVESPKYYWTGSFFSPAVPSDPQDVAFEIQYIFHPFYHPFTRLFWHQLSSGEFDLLYDANLQENPDQIDPSGTDVFSFNTWYSPTAMVTWDHDDVTGQDRQFLDFRYSAPYSVYHWELFYHVPRYIADLLNQNQQFEDAQKWYQYIFNPTRQTTDPVPQRFWIPKPLHNLTPTQILSQEINVLLQAVNQGNVEDINEIENWRNNPFNPFLLADQRNVAYMKSTVMAYIDNIVDWADNLFASESREALSEATLLYVIASEILGPQPVAVTPPNHADQSFDQLFPSLDAFANAMVEIENSIGGTGGTVSGTGASGPSVPGLETFYFKIPSNPTLLQKWTTVADRLNKLRHCQNIAGAPLQLALFDAPIDPGLLIRAQAAGVDFSSVLSDISAPLPNYRFTSLYTIAMDFVNAVRSYGGSLQGALEKSDGDQLALMTANNQQQMFQAADQVFQWQIDQQQKTIDAMTQGIAVLQAKYDFNTSQEFANAAEITAVSLHAASAIIKVISAATQLVSAGTHLAPQFNWGVAGIGGTPMAFISDGGENLGKAPHRAGLSWTSLSDVLEIAAGLSTSIGSWQRRNDTWVETAKETQIQIAQNNTQKDGANIALQINQLNQQNHTLQEQQQQNQIDFLTGKFSNQDLYDWMVDSLATTYFQSYQMAYQICKQVERCYRYELGIPDSSFIQFGYWDSLHKGLLSGESLNQDLRRMQASYLQQNARRYELSRFISLTALSPTAVQQLLVNGACDFDLTESLFDNDYPGHFNRRLTRVSITVVYPNPGKFDNIKASLTLVSNKVRVSTDTGPGYPENPVGSDPRFNYNYGAVPQKIALGNGQDDPGLFITAIASNIADQRYLPFENAGAVSSWHLDMPQLNNEVDLSTVGDVVIHLYYTALDGGDTLRAAVAADNLANFPNSGSKLFSALNDFTAPPATVANPYPQAPWSVFLSTPAAGSNQVLTLSISPSKFPPWTRGKTISATSLTVIIISWVSGNYVIAPQGTLPAAQVVLTPVAGVTEPNVCSANIPLPANTALGTWSFELQQQGAADFHSLTKNQIGDLLLIVNFSI